jgi:hypothetical protein
VAGSSTRSSARGRGSRTRSSPASCEPASTTREVTRT